MVSLLSKSVGLNTVSSLLDVLSDADKVKGHIAEIRKAESDYIERVKADQVTLQEGLRKLKDDRKTLEADRADLTARAANVDTGEEDLRRRQAELNKTVADFKDFEHKTSEALAEREKKLEVAETTHGKVVKDKSLEHQTKDTDLTAREKDLAAREARAEAREKDLIAREAAMAAREAQMREFLK